MAKFLDELENFDPAEEKTALTNDRLRIFYDFLEDIGYTKLFVYMDFIDGSF